MSKVTWKKSKVDGRVGVNVSYNAVFNEQLKAAVPSAKFDRQSDSWFFDEEAKDEVIPLLEKFYLATSRYRVAWDIRSASGIEIDGAWLLFVSRDYYKFRHDHGLEFKIVENELSAGGSRNHPRISGKLVLEISLREGAVIEPAPDEIEAVVEDETAVRPNPLAAYPTSDLVTELERRGERPAFAELDNDVLIAELINRGSEMISKDVLRTAMESALKQLLPEDLSEANDEVKKSLRMFILYTRRELGI